ncbi:MAG: aldehyde ferredoxin oxidoreductase family protein [Deltaproteobacteria bacterium]|nr:aldehyde ferredoxin oxidoreductase family protein [Deltaproteobacteria bacterium]
MGTTNFPYGSYAGFLLRVNLNTEQIEREPVSPDLAREFIGSLGMAARLFYREVPARTDPFTEKNKLMIMAGPLVGTHIPAASRVGVFSRSPLTETFFYSHAGGHFGPEMKYAGIDGIVLEGKAPHPVYLWINDERVEVRPARHLWGKRCSETIHAIREEVGDDRAEVAVIGPSGESLSRLACVIFGVRAAGRGGLGAVMGAKNVKAVAVRGRGAVEVPDMARFREVIDGIYEKIRANPALSKVVPKYGTPGLVMANNTLGVLGTRNWQQEVFEEAQGINADAMVERIKARNKACFACPVGCSTYSVIREGKYKGTVEEGPEYENLFSMGSMCCISSVDAVSHAEWLCDEYGMDAIEAGVCVAFAMEAYEKGILGPGDTGGLELRFGNEDAMVQVINMIARREGLGDVLAEGVRRAAQKIGKGSEAFAMHNKGLAVAGHSARGMPGLALGYATGPRGGSHHDGRPSGERLGLLERNTIEGKAAYTAKINDLMVFTDALGLCHILEGIWGPLEITPVSVECLNAATGMNMSLEEARRAADRIWNQIRAIMVLDGHSRRTDRLPRRFMEEPIPEGPSAGMHITDDQLNRMLDEYYAYRGWNDNGIPTRERLERLGLADAAADLHK